MVVKDKRGRRRYIVFEIEAPGPVRAKDLVRAIRNETAALGDGAGQRIRPWVIGLGATIGILRCAHTEKASACAILTDIHELGHDRMPVTIRTRGTSGTIRAAKDKFMSAEERERYDTHRDKQ